jgi:hypothetical protein
MAEEAKDVKEEVAEPTPVQEEIKQSEEVSEDVKTPKDVIDKDVYVKVREDMKAERAAKREAQAKTRELEERIAELESRGVEEPDLDGNDPRVEVLYQINKDPFVKDNLDLIEEKMATEKMDIKSAVSAVKSEMFDRIQREVTTAPESKTLKQEKPTATAEDIPKSQLTGDPEKDIQAALRGELDINPAQLESIKRYLRQK